MENNLLDYFSRTHAQYIHAKGKIATSILIQQLNCQPNEDILEIGFGTGTTLVALYSNNKKTNFSGLELSPLMYKTAKARLQFCLIGESVQLALANNKGQIPYQDSSFDKVYLESVLSIQEGKDLECLLKEIRRVLKSNGKLIMNETIWLESTTFDEINKVNEYSKKSYGIILSTSDYPYLKNWKELLEELGFKCEESFKLDDYTNNSKANIKFAYRMLSSTFTALGKIKSFLIPSMMKQKKKFFKTPKEINPDNKKLMEGIIISANLTM